jgi:hypothetical protein
MVALTLPQQDKVSLGGEGRWWNVVMQRLTPVQASSPAKPCAQHFAGSLKRDYWLLGRQATLQQHPMLPC